MKELFDALLPLGRSVYFVPGNHETRELRPPSGITYLHGTKARLGGHAIGGLGGSNITPFGTPFELDDDEAAGILSSLGPLDILVSHCPPSGTECDVTHSGQHIGSEPVRRYVISSPPKLVLCGHVHESSALDSLEGAQIANPGPLMAGNYATIEISNTVGVELKSVSFR